VRPYQVQWLTAIILATCKAEILRITVQGHPGQIFHKTPISKTTRAKWTEDVAQALKHLQSLEFKPECHQKKKKQAPSSNPSTATIIKIIISYLFVFGVQIQASQRCGVRCNSYHH
jgi:hypothetical protein